MNPDPPLTIAFLAGFCRECHWMRKSRDWKERLLYRLARYVLDSMTQQALGGEPHRPGFAERVEKKRNG